MIHSLRNFICISFGVALAGAPDSAAQDVAIATFEVDATPPIGSPLCDGLVLPARKVVDRLSARGIAIFSSGGNGVRGKPIVLCAVDWVGIGNSGHDAWRRALAAAVDTDIDRVSVHALHPHDAPGCDFAAEELLAAHGLAGKMFPVAFARDTIRRAADALRVAARQPVPVTHFAIGKAKVERVASNRRLLGTDGKVAHVRFSKCADPAVRALPEGVIDPWVRVLAFFQGERPVAALSYYATHPQSYYGSGGVSPDFVGLARNRCERELAGVRWIHFNGAGGNVAAGKYNDGRPDRRGELTERLAVGMRRAWRDAQRPARRTPLRAADIDLTTVSVRLPPSKQLEEAALLQLLGDTTLRVAERVRAARDIVFLRRARAGTEITLQCLALGSARVLHMPGELFVEYQLLASRLRPDLTVCTAAYGDYGPGYIGTQIAYSQGGYETGRVSRVAPAVEGVLHDGIRKLLEVDVAPYRVGAAAVKITPAHSIRLAGYAARTQPSSGVLQELHAKALAIVDQKGNRLLLLTVDLLGITKAIADRVCAGIADACEIERPAIMIATSHTHTAPALQSHLAPMFDFSAEERDRVDEYTKLVEDRMVQVAQAAFANLAPAQLAYGTGQCDFAVNRRNNKEVDVPKLREAKQLAGPVDHTVPVLRVTAPDGKLRAVVFGYACHNTVLSFRRISGDYAGFAQSALEDTHPDVTAMFVAGCGGDQNPLPRREVALAQRYGKQLAASVDAVLTTQMTPIAGPVHAALLHTDLRFERVPTVAELRATLEHENVYERRRAALLLERFEQDGKIADRYPFPVQAWQFGTALTLVALGGEAVVDYALLVKQEFGSRTFVAAYCNDVMGYVPSRRVWEEGGYEGGGAMLYYGQPSRWRGTVEDDVMRTVRKVVATVRNQAAIPLAEELPRIPPTPAGSAAESFRVAPGLRVELVAAEPHVVDPVDMAIDENGDIWVLEMIDYPFDARDGHRPAGRVRVLRDTDGDGRVDTSRVFADKLSWPTGLALWNGGVFVAAAPNLLYLKDADGDGRADRDERSDVVFTGFGRHNVQTLANNLVLQPDGWFYGAGGGNGGSIVTKKQPGERPVLLRGRDFRFRADGRFESLTGGGQFGHAIDDFGRRFVCNNSDHARHVVLEQRYLNRNRWLAPPSTIASIATEGGAGPVFRVSPPEPWRIVRTRWRVAGKVKGPIEHGGAVSGYFTSATGISVYRGTALPGSDGDLIIGDVASNLVHHKKLVPNGATFHASRAETGCELLASTDIWFRPVNFANGPDGALYVCDMYREIVEHPWSLPDDIKKHVDLMSGNDRGRIWRILGVDTEPRPDLGFAKIDVVELVKLLDHRDGWWRDTAARLLLERRDPKTADALRAALGRATAAPGRVMALQLLRTFGGLDVHLILDALRHDDPRVREVAVRLAESAPRSTELRAGLTRLTDDADPRVRFQLACTLGQFPGSEIASALARLGRRDGDDPWTRFAILSSASECAAQLLAELGHDAPLPLLRELGAMLGTAEAEAKGAGHGSAVIRFGAAGDAAAAAVIRGFAVGLSRGGSSFDRWFLTTKSKPSPAALRPLFATAEHTLADPSRTLAERLEAVLLCGLQPIQRCGMPLYGLLAPHHPPALQTGAIAAIAAHDHPHAAELLFAEWPNLSPGMRQRVLDRVSAQPMHMGVLVDQLRRGRVASSTLTPAQVGTLRQSKDPTIRRRVGELLGEMSGERSGGAAAKPAANRADVIRRYLPALTGATDAERGRKVFETSCAVCHRVGKQGNAIGPDLETVRERSAESLLAQILDPNREINPAYLLYLVTLRDGRNFAGSIGSETATAIALVTADGKRQVLLRSQITKLEATRVSLMPEGLEANITPAAMADLIAFIKQQ